MITPTRSSSRGHHSVVVGSGLAGLSAACILAARGHRVTLIEKNPWLGGKAAQLDAHGFRFDMGPTIVTMPKVLKRIFEEAGRSMDDYLQMVRLDPQWRCFFDDGLVLDLEENPQQMAEHLRRKLAAHPESPDTGSHAGASPEDSATGYERFTRYAQRLHHISDRFFFWKSIGGLGDMFDMSNSFKASTLMDVLNMRLGRSVASTIRSYVPDARVAQMLDHFTQYVGSSPYNSPAVLCGIAHMQTDEGIWYPMGGTRAIPEALSQLAGELGVNLMTGRDVKRLVTQPGKRGRPRLTHVELDDGSSIACDSVVSNMDAVRTHRELIGGAVGRRFDRRRDHEPACSGIVLYLGLSKRYDHLLHHGFVFSRDPHEEFDAIYNQGEPAPDPTCYLASTSRTEPTTAPEGGDALYVLVHTPYLRPHHDWSRDGELFTRYRRTILAKLKTTGAMPDIEDRIVFEDALTPQDIHERYRVLNGAIYGLASHGKFRGAFKPANRSKLVDGLYLAGGAAHPGPGMPMVMMSGWIAADALDHDVKGAAAREPVSEQTTAAQPAAV